METSPLPAISQNYAGAEATPFIDPSLLPTMRLTAVSQNYTGTEATSLIDTLLLPAMKFTAKRQFIRIGGRSNLGGQKENNLVRQEYLPHFPLKQRDYSQVAQHHKLKPIQLQPPPHHPGHIPITDPGVESQFFDRVDDDSPIFEDEIRPF